LAAKCDEREKRKRTAGKTAKGIDLGTWGERTLNGAVLNKPPGKTNI